MNVVVDVDDIKSWPEEVRAAVASTAEDLRNTTRDTSDLDVSPDDDCFRALFRGRMLLAYHCTRLLDSEVDQIRSAGMRMLTEGLVVDKLRLAEADGAITPGEARNLRAGSVFAGDRHHNRTNRVCVFTGRSTFDDHVAGLWRLLTTWGGEAIYFTTAGDEHEARLRSIGSASIVVLGVDITGSWREHHASPGLLASFVGSYLGLEDHGAEIHFAADIPAEHVLDIWHPGHPEFDRHAELLDAIDLS